MDNEAQKHLYVNSPGITNDSIAENIEVASQCLSQAFSIDLNNEDQKKKYSLKGENLPALLQFALKAKAENWGPRVAAPAATAAPAAAPAPDASEAAFHRFVESLTAKNYFKDAPPGSDEYNQRLQRAREKFFARKQDGAPQDSPAKAPAAAGHAASTSSTPALKTNPFDLPQLPPLMSLSAEEKAKRTQAGEQFKLEGNQKMAEKQYKEAVEAYSKAIQQNNTVAVYFANRAAALSFVNEHHSAILDCQRATELDPTYPKAYSRWGHACFSLGQYKEAVEQYKKAVALDPGNVNLVDSLAKAEERLQATTGAASSPLAARATSAAPATGGATLPPLPDLSQVPELSNLAGVFNNPQFMTMAQQMMQNPAFMEMANNMMQNPEALNGMMQNVLGRGAKQ